MVLKTVTIVEITFRGENVDFLNITLGEDEEEDVSSCWITLRK
jgi:hypothetical protein